MNNFLSNTEVMYLYFMQLTLVVEPLLNISCRHSFYNFVKIPQKFLPFPCQKQLLNQHIFYLRRIRFQYCGQNFKQIEIQKILKPYISATTGKNLQIAKTFSKNVNIEATYFFKKQFIFFFAVIFCLFTCTNQRTNPHKIADLLTFIK